MTWWLLSLGGLGAGLLAGLLGIGGGTVLVPLLTSLGYPYNQSVAISSLAIVIIATSGTWQNWRMGFLDFKRVIPLALPAIVSAQLGVYLVGELPNFVKEAGFGLLLLLTIFLAGLKKRLTHQEPLAKTISPRNLLISRLVTGTSAGFLAGLFGVGGGVIMVPLQMILLGEKIKLAIQTSLGVIVLTSLSACLGHAYAGNILWLPGVFLGLGGLLGSQVSTRYLPKLPDRLVNLAFKLLLALLAGHFFQKAWHSYFL